MSEDTDLVGSVRRFGPYGPMYEVLATVLARGSREAALHIRVVESGEELEYGVASAHADPLAE